MAEPSGGAQIVVLWGTSHPSMQKKEADSGKQFIMMITKYV
jgi:hypothetical protein